MEEKKYNLIIIGAGPAGSMAAKTAAESGLSVLMVESRLQIGVPVQCAEGVSKKQLDKLIDVKPEHISKKIKGFEIYSPDKTKVFVGGNGYVLERKIFDRWLAEKAIEAGAEIMIDAKAIGLIKNEKDIAVKIKSSEKEYNLSADIVIGADGPASVVGKWAGINTDLNPSDIMICQQFIAAGIENLDCAECYMGNEIAPAGYAWVFPKSTQEVNAGIGVTGGKGIGSPKKYFIDFKKKYPLLFESTVIDGKGGAVPVRRPLKSLVGDGVAFVGDAALQVNPIHGGGIGAGMRAGIILGEVAREAIAKRDVTAKGLWSYNTRYLSNFGKRLAALEIFRRLLQSVSDEELNYGFEKRILEAGDLMAANKGDGFSLSPIEKLKRVQRGAGKLSLLLKIQKTASLMKKMSKAYAAYPSNSAGLDAWEKKVLGFIEDANFE